MSYNEWVTMNELQWMSYNEWVMNTMWLKRINEFNELNQSNNLFVETVIYWWLMLIVMVDVDSHGFILI